MLTVANSILDGSEPFQYDMSMNNWRMKNVHTPVNYYVAVDKLFYETRYRKMKNDHQLKISNDGRWDAKDKTDQYQYLGNCPPTPPLTQQQSIDNNFYVNQIDKNIDENRWTLTPMCDQDRISP